MISDLDENEESEKAVENLGLRDIDDLAGPPDMHGGKESDGSFGNHFHEIKEAPLPLSKDYESKHKQASDAKKKSVEMFGKPKSLKLGGLSLDIDRINKEHEEKELQKKEDQEQPP